MITLCCFHAQEHCPGPDSLFQPVHHQDTTLIVDAHNRGSAFLAQSLDDLARSHLKAECKAAQVGLNDFLRVSDNILTEWKTLNAALHAASGEECILTVKAPLHRHQGNPIGAAVRILHELKALRSVRVVSFGMGSSSDVLKYVSRFGNEITAASLLHLGPELQRSCLTSDSSAVVPLVPLSLGTSSFTNTRFEWVHLVKPEHASRLTSESQHCNVIHPSRLYLTRPAVPPPELIEVRPDPAPAADTDASPAASKLKQWLQQLNDNKAPKTPPVSTDMAEPYPPLLVSRLLERQLKADLLPIPDPSKLPPFEVWGLPRRMPLATVLISDPREGLHSLLTRGVISKRPLPGHLHAACPDHSSLDAQELTNFYEWFGFKVQRAVPRIRVDENETMPYFEEEWPDFPAELGSTVARCVYQAISSGAPGLLFSAFPNGLALKSPAEFQNSSTPVLEVYPDLALLLVNLQRYGIPVVALRANTPPLGKSRSEARHASFLHLLVDRAIWQVKSWNTAMPTSQRWQQFQSLVS